ncbi:hypothetical protein F6U93_05500 [Tamlana haliotis]|uniref:DUF4890 domain-containing protein n=1 Tax=Pseudotamlana haliotis TaxID=2614804 RepID=A0A6N6MG91_9FLAO|nr:Spy/CpxP family protein refolding chaperone [Tamlana haliotis]KAB1068861.1 hypothetical protein F6U93_05500 [Tamlana haliotis]
MKKIILIAIALIGLQGVAQENRKEGKRNHDRHEQKMDLTPEQIATLKTKKMTLALDLTASQQSEIQAINLEKANKRKAKMEERKANKDKEKPKMTSEARYNMQIAMLDAQIAEKAKFRNILNEDQYKKFEKMQMKMKKRGKQHKQDKNKGKHRNG